MSLLIDPHFWMGAGAGLFVGFLIAFPLALLLVRSRDDRQEIVGVIRRSS